MIYELAKALMAKKEVGPAIICFILSNAVEDVLDLWRMRTQFQLKQAQNTQQRQAIQMAQFERCVLYKLAVKEAGLDDSQFSTSAGFQRVISDIATLLTSNSVAAAIAMKFSALCQSNQRGQTT